jgi:TniQ
MKGFTSSLWPIRYKPLPDELLSSWLVRLAHGHGMKAQPFCNAIFGPGLQVWNRDIDRLAPEWLIQELCDRTGTTLQAASATTLRVYEGFLYPVFRTTGTLKWIQTLQMYHRKRKGFGLQFCPQCLRESSEPYFRKSWRVAYNTTCLRHQCMLHDRCSKCGASVAFHRLNMGQSSSLRIESLATCHQCGFDLRRANTTSIVTYNSQTTAWHRILCIKTLSGHLQRDPVSLDAMNVMHHVIFMLSSRYSRVRLKEYVCEQLNVADMTLTPGYPSFESRPLAERHHLIQLMAWLMIDLEPRLRVAWRAKAIRYNLMFKDFSDAPDWYLNIVEGFSDWRRDANG